MRPVLVAAVGVGVVVGAGVVLSEIANHNENRRNAETHARLAEFERGTRDGLTESTTLSPDEVAWRKEWAVTHEPWWRQA